MSGPDASADTISSPSDPAVAVRSAPELTAQVAAELGLPHRGVAAVIALLDERATVPFIARYRKERTGGLDEVQIRAIEERRTYLGELEQRRAVVRASIESQGKLDAALAAQIAGATTKQALEDLYLPYKPRRRTKAMIALEQGLGPLAERIWAQPAEGDPRAEAAAFVDPAREVADVDAALAGAREIVAERVAEHAELRALVRHAFGERGMLRARVMPGKEGERSKFEDYYDHSEPVAKIASHRYLAIRRGEREGVLRTGVELSAETIVPALLDRLGHDRRSPFAGEFEAAVGAGYRRRLSVSIETDVRLELKARADREAIEVFADNLRNLLLAAPLGGKPVVGIDPGLRTGCKCVAVDETGRFLETVTIFPARGAAERARAAATLGEFLRRHAPAAVAVGNGTGGRETEALAREVVRDQKLGCAVVSVSESGASVYSASEIAREEFPELDLTVRGAISIARRLQDPLAELVKIDPKSIGVGQYQHDVSQPPLQRKLGEVVESCVNAVGVELNTASAPLLAHVAGVGEGLARKIVAHRDRCGRFTRRAQLLEVSGLGPRAYEQAAGFLRVRDSEDPLDGSAVHPERYPLVQRIAGDLGVQVRELVGNEALIARIDAARYLDGEVGEATMADIMAELRKPGRDPRKVFEVVSFRDDVHELTDLEPGMRLTGLVTNVTHFGAFVDVGVHQDGLVHISQLADHFVKDPREVVKVGDRISVTVLEVDLERRRIGLSARSKPELPEASGGAVGAHTGQDRAPAGERSRGQKGKGSGQRRNRESAPASGGESGAGFRHNPFADLARRRGG